MVGRIEDRELTAYRIPGHAVEDREAESLRFVLSRREGQGALKKLARGFGRMDKMTDEMKRELDAVLNTVKDPGVPP